MIKKLRSSYNQLRRVIYLSLEKKRLFTHNQYYLGETLTMESNLYSYQKKL